jgi:hypothetical protein
VEGFLSQNKYLNDPDYLFSLLACLVKRNNGVIRITREELKNVTSGDLVGMYWDPLNKEILLKTVKAEEVLKRTMGDTEEGSFEN